jgi:hypothetical protein
MNFRSMSPTVSVIIGNNNYGRFRLRTGVRRGSVSRLPRHKVASRQRAGRDDHPTNRLMIG